MTDDFERGVRDRLQLRAQPGEDDLARLTAFVGALPARRRRFSGRSTDFWVALVGLAAAVLIGIVLLVGLAGRGPSDGASPSPSAAVSPSPSSSSSAPTTLAPCPAAALAIAGSRQGEVSTVNVGVAITNTRTTACTLGGLPKTVEILRASGVPLALTMEPGHGNVVGRVVLQPGVQGAAWLTFYWMNWCEASPGDLQVRVDFDGRGAVVTGSLAGPLLPTCLDPSQGSSIQIDGIGPGNLQRPAPGGTSSPSPFAGLQVDGAGPFGTEGIWADANGQLLTSNDRGANWQTVGPWGLNSDVVDADHAWTVTPGPGSTEQNGSSSDVLHFVISRTSNGGRTWIAASVPGDYPETSPAVRFLNPMTGYLLAAAQRFSDGVGTVLRTSDGGATWHVMSKPTWPGSTFGISQDGTLWIGANAEAGPVAHPLLMASRDGGTTWSKAVLPGLEGRTGGPDLYVPEPPVFWSASEGIVEVADSAGAVRLYRTSNGGRTWTLATQRSTGGEGGGTEGGAFVSQTDWLLAETGGAGEVLVRSTDGGSSWTTTTPTGSGPFGAGIRSLGFWDELNGIAVGFGDSGSPLLLTSDSGDTWTPVGGP